MQTTDSSKQLILEGAQLYLRCFPLSDKCFVDCISVCLLFRCFALPLVSHGEWIWKRRGSVPAVGHCHILSAWEYKCDPYALKQWVHYGTVRMLISSILPYVCLWILSYILHLLIFLHFEVAPTWSYPVFDLADIIIMDLCLSWVPRGLAPCPRSLEKSWLSGTWQVHCFPLSGTKPSTFTSVPELLCLYLAYFISEYFKGDTVSNPLDFQHNPVHFSLDCSLRQKMLL